MAALAARDVPRLSDPRRHPVPALQSPDLADLAARGRAGGDGAVAARAVPRGVRHGVLDEATRLAAGGRRVRRSLLRAVVEGDGPPASLDLRQLDVRLAVDAGGPRRPQGDRSRALRFAH